MLVANCNLKQARFLALICLLRKKDHNNPKVRHTQGDHTIKLKYSISSNISIFINIAQNILESRNWPQCFQSQWKHFYTLIHLIAIKWNLNTQLKIQKTWRSQILLGGFGHMWKLLHIMEKINITPLTQ